MKKKFIILISLLSLFFITKQTHAQVSTTDSLALVDLFNSTNGSNWTNHTNWLTTQPVSTWFGVTVGGGNVTELALDSNNLVGTIPASFGNLVNLINLYLDNNPFSSHTPIPDLHNCNHLALFNFSYISVSDTIPAWLMILPTLDFLRLEHDSLTGQLPASISPSLQLFTAYGNQLTGSLPASYGAHQHWGVLALDSNQLSGELPDNWSLFDFDFNTLPQLSVSHNQFTGAIPYSLSFVGSFAFGYFNDNHFTSISSAISNSFTLGLAVQNNNLTFDGLEQLVQSTAGEILANPQAIIPLHVNGNILSVYAGGTLANNTYSWYKDNVLYQTNTGDSTITITQAGSYSVQVSNSIVTPYILSDLLVLNSDTLLVNTVLPLTLLNFTGQLQNNAAVLKWQTANEINTKDFIVEKSNDATNFLSIGTVSALGATGFTNTYNYSDNIPLQGNNYYRLKMEDIDGRFTYSNVVRINLNKNALLAVSPLPAHDVITITGAENFTNIQFIDASGKVLKQFSKPSSNVFSVQDLNPDIYFIRLSSATNVQTLKIIKQ